MIAYNNRLLVVGSTRSGKSELLNVIASGLRNQWVLVDPKDEFAIDGVEKQHDAGALDFAGERILHYVPPPDVDEVERFFGRVLALRQAEPPGQITVVVHELQLLVNFRPGLAGPNLNTTIAQGEAHGLGFWGATVRPKLVPTLATSEPAVVVAMAEKLTRADDHQTVADAMGVPPATLADAQQHVLAQHGRHGYVRLSRRDGDFSGWAPLPEQLRAANIVRRTTPE